MINDLLVYAYKKELDILRDMSAGVGAHTDEEFFRVIKNLVHSLLDCEERFRNQINDLNDKELFQAFRFVNNQLKHDNGFISLLHREDGGTFPLKVDGTGRFYHYTWNESKKLGKNFRYKEQKKAYEKILKGKAIIYTFEKVDMIIHKYIGE